MTKEELKNFEDKTYYVINQAERNYRIHLINQIKLCKIIKVGVKLIHYKYICSDGTLEETVHKASVSNMGTCSFFSSRAKAELFCIRNDLINGIKDKVNVLSDKELLNIVKLINSKCKQDAISIDVVDINKLEI